jgi:hypothetical protein
MSAVWTPPADRLRAALRAPRLYELYTPTGGSETLELGGNRLILK